MSRVRTMTAAKRWIALAAAVLLVAVAAATIGAIARTVTESREGADPAAAFSDVDPFDAEVRWTADRDDLARTVDSTSRDDLAMAWIRSRDALERAAAGDTSGLAEWFTDGALDLATARYAGTTGSVEAPRSTAYELSVAFVSVDGQVVVLDVVAIDDDSRSASSVVMILDDSAWRIRAVTAR